MADIIDMPKGTLTGLLVGPFEQWRVMVDGRVIPRLTGRKNGDRIDLIVDGRFSASFSESDARQAAWLIAQAMAIGEGYSHLGAESKDRPFAPKGFEIENPNH
jgi:hypothetical protein